VPLTGKETFGPYRLLSPIKISQNTQIWVVMNDSKGQRYAMKTLLSRCAHNREQIGLLRQEFAVGTSLKHKRIIEMYELSEDRERPFVIMELFQAPNMKDHIQKGTDPLLPVMPKVVLQSAESLAYFHTQGWIHRDIKPDNFLVDAQGEVKLIDFALAQKRQGFLARLLSGKGKIQGTRSYLSPEQIRCVALDQRSDIYSFGCTLFHLLAAQPPYTGKDTNDLLNKHLKSMIPSIEAYNRNVTPEFSKLLRSMMAKTPDGRPASMMEFVETLRTIKVLKQQPRLVS
jgi:serine/threonine protein kinase